GVGEFLDEAPPARVWLLEGLLLLGIVGLLVAGGGTGKSYLMLQLAVSIVTGRPFLGLAVEEPGSVLLICGEDDRDEIHRRRRRVVGSMRERDEFGEREDALVRERLRIASRVGEDNLITTVADGVTVRTN